VLTVGDMSIRSAPVFLQGRQAVGAPPGLRKSPIVEHKRTASAVTAYTTPTTSSTTSRTSLAPPRLRPAVPSPPPPARPRSLYVPFIGCVDKPPEPPGRAARDILHALSYAPTSSSQGSLSSSRSSGGASSSWASSAGSVSPKYSHVLPCIPQSPPRDLRSKSSSLATLISVSPPPSTPSAAAQPTVALRLHRRLHHGQLPLSYSTQELIQFMTPSPLGSGSTLDEDGQSGRRRRFEEPVYSPTNPSNNSENRALLTAHPPVIHPPKISHL